MKQLKKISLLALIISLFTFFIVPQTVHAENETQGDGLEEILVNGNDFEGEDCGWVNVDIKNLDKTVNKNINIQIINFDIQQVYTIVLTKPNGYKATERLPVGKYTFMQAMVEGDNKSIYPIDAIEGEFEVSHEKPGYIGLEMEDESLFQSSKRDTDAQKKANKKYKEEIEKKKQSKEKKKSTTVGTIMAIVIGVVIAIIVGAFFIIKKIQNDY